ncbi:MAG: hypothetical protein QOE61_1255 [Micromonosporaceae bacterium]|jgi:hypothetical protein|nr:hypothetical protein [Micromonosporaceae bacterium]
MNWALLDHSEYSSDPTEHRLGERPTSLGGRLLIIVGASIHREEISRGCGHQPSSAMSERSGGQYRVNPEAE